MGGDQRQFSHLGGMDGGGLRTPGFCSELLHRAGGPHASLEHTTFILQKQVIPLPLRLAKEDEIVALQSMQLDR